jgi:hypothetical protein
MYAIRLLESRQKNSAMYLPVVFYESTFSLFREYIKVTNLDLSLFVVSSLNRTTTWGYRSNRKKEAIVLFIDILGAMHFIKFLQTTHPVSHGNTQLVPEEVPASIIEKEHEKYLF